VSGLKKYLFEFIVIFVGITASLIVDEWRQSRNERVLEEQYVREFLEDVIVFEKRLDLIEANLNIEMRHMSQALSKQYKPDSLPVIATFPFYFKPLGDLNSNAFRTLVATGDINLISNRRLFTVLNDIGESHQLLIDGIHRCEEAYLLKLQPVINRHYAMTEAKRFLLEGTQVDPARFERLIGDKDFVEFISEMILWNNLNKAFIATTRERIRELKSLIQAELDRYK